jgi:putative ABC transport system substrate-binding protein
VRASKTIISVGLGTLLLNLCVPAEAQPPAKIPRIGYLTAGSPSSVSARVEAFRKGLGELGYVAGKNLVIEWRYAEGKIDRLPAFVAELVDQKVDVLVSGGPQTTRLAKKATATIPIVMAFDNNPLGNGLIDSLARPGGNVTGLSTLAPELSGKQLELLKEIVPKLSRLTVLGNSNEAANRQSLEEIQSAARAFGVQLHYLDVLGPRDVETVFRAAPKEGSQAVLVLGNPVAIFQRAQIAELAVKSRLPVIHYATEFVQDGGLMTYGPSITDLFHRAATYVDKILKGAKPADLPVEQPTKFELVINLQAAKQIGLTIPPNVLARADRVIK